MTYCLFFQYNNIFCCQHLICFQFLLYNATMIVKLLTEYKALMNYNIILLEICRNLLNKHTWTFITFLTTSTLFIRLNIRSLKRLMYKIVSFLFLLFCMKRFRVRALMCACVCVILLSVWFCLIKKSHRWVAKIKFFIILLSCLLNKNY